MNNNLKRINIYSIYLGALILILPLIAFFINAFSFRWFYPQVIPKELSLQAWVRLKLIPKPGQRTFEGFIDLWASNPTVIKALVNSLTIGILVTIVSIIIALPAARVLGLLNFRFKKLIIFIMVSPTILPPIAFVLGLNINFISIGFSGSFFGVCLVHLVPIMPYVVLTMTGIFANYNPDFEHQARTLVQIKQLLFSNNTTCNSARNGRGSSFCFFSILESVSTHLLDRSRKSNDPSSFSFFYCIFW